MVYDSPWLLPMTPPPLPPVPSNVLNRLEALEAISRRDTPLTSPRGGEPGAFSRVETTPKSAINGIDFHAGSVRSVPVQSQSPGIHFNLRDGTPFSPPARVPNYYSNGTVDGIHKAVVRRDAQMQTDIDSFFASHAAEVVNLRIALKEAEAKIGNLRADWVELKDSDRRQDAELSRLRFGLDEQKEAMVELKSYMEAARECRTSIPDSLARTGSTASNTARKLSVASDILHARATQKSSFSDLARSCDVRPSLSDSQIQHPECEPPHMSSLLHTLAGSDLQQSNENGTPASLQAQLLQRSSLSESRGPFAAANHQTWDAPDNKSAIPAKASGMDPTTETFISQQARDSSRNSIASSLGYRAEGGDHVSITRSSGASIASGTLRAHSAHRTSFGAHGRSAEDTPQDVSLEQPRSSGAVSLSDDMHSQEARRGSHFLGRGSVLSSEAPNVFQQDHAPEYGFLSGARVSSDSRSPRASALHGWLGRGDVTPENGVQDVFEETDMRDFARASGASTSSVNQQEGNSLTEALKSSAEERLTLPLEVTLTLRKSSIELASAIEAQIEFPTQGGNLRVDTPMQHVAETIVSHARSSGDSTHVRNALAAAYVAELTQRVVPLLPGADERDVFPSSTDEQNRSSRRSSVQEASKVCLNMLWGRVLGGMNTSVDVTPGPQAVGTSLTSSLVTGSPRSRSRRSRSETAATNVSEWWDNGSGEVSGRSSFIRDTTSGRNSVLRDTTSGRNSVLRDDEWLATSPKTMANTSHNVEASQTTAIDQVLDDALYAAVEHLRSDAAVLEEAIEAKLSSFAASNSGQSSPKSMVTDRVDIVAENVLTHARRHSQTIDSAPVNPDGLDLQNVNARLASEYVVALSERLIPRLEGLVVEQSQARESISSQNETTSGQETYSSSMRESLQLSARGSLHDGAYVEPHVALPYEAFHEDFLIQGHTPRSQRNSTQEVRSASSRRSSLDVVNTSRRASVQDATKECIKMLWDKVFDGLVDDGVSVAAASAAKNEAEDVVDNVFEEAKAVRRLKPSRSVHFGEVEHFSPSRRSSYDRASSDGLVDMEDDEDEEHLAEYWEGASPNRNSFFQSSFAESHFRGGAQGPKWVDVDLMALEEIESDA